MTTRSRWIAFVSVLVGLALLVVGGAAAFFGVQEYRRSSWLRTAQEAFGEGDWKTASTHLSRYLPHHPDDTALLAMYAEANGHVLDDRPAALRNVAHAYQQILRYEPGNMAAKEKLLDLYERQGAWDVLEYYAADWLRHQPESRVLLGARALALDKSGSRDDALAAYEKLFALHDGDSFELGRYAGLLRERKSAADADAFLAGLLGENPSSPDVLVGYAQYWIEVGDLEMARHYIDLAVESDPNFRAHHLLRARIAASERRWEEALALLELDGPPDPELVSLRANLFLADGDGEAAARVLAATAEEIRIDHPRLQILLIDSLYGLDRVEEAREASGLYLRAYPLDTATRNYVDGRDALAEQRYSDAASALSVAVEMRPDFRAARLALAVATIKSGDSPSGRGVLEAYLRENPGDARARSLWTSYFGLSLEEAERLARASLDDADGDAETMLAAAESMLNAAILEGVLTDRAAAISKLAERVADITPESPAPYRLLIGLWLRMGNTPRAHEVLAAAEDSGVGIDDLHGMSGTVALAEGNVELAWSSFESTAANLDEDGRRRWARLFARAGAFAESMLVLDTADSNVDDDLYRVDRAELAVEFGPIDVAWEELQAMEAASHSGGISLAGLNRIRLMIAIRYSESLDVERAGRLRDLAESVKQADDASALVVQAIYALHGDAPEMSKAESLLKSAEQRAPGDALVLDRLRAFYEHTDQLDRALHYARQTSTAAPINDRFRFELGRLQASSGLYLEAERTLRDVLARQPANVRARVVLVQALLDSGQIEAAEKMTDSVASESGSTDDQSDRLRSQILMARNSHEEAESLLRDRLARSPGDASARWDLAVCVRELGRAEEGLALLDQAATVADATAEDWSLLARFHVEDSSNAESERGARAALRGLLLDPNHADSLRILAQLREREGDAAAALAILRRYTEARPNDAAAWYRRTQLELATGGHWRDALVSIERAYAASPEVGYRALRGFIHAGLENYAEAIDDLEEAAADLPVTSVQFDLTLAECYLHTDSLEQADHRLAAAERKNDRNGAIGFEKISALRAELGSRRDAE